VKDDGVHDGPTNMARDAGLLDLVEPGCPAFRVYGWDGAWVSLGYSQKPERALLSDAPVRWVMRPTGGKAVLHGHDVTVGLAVSLVDLGLANGTRDVETAFLGAGAFLRDALRTCGLECDFAAREPGRNAATSDCFAYSAPNDLVDSLGRKVCGCAQKLTAEAVLTQASIPADEPLVDPRLVYPHPGPIHWVTITRERMAGALADLLQT